MIDFPHLSDLVQKTSSKIVMLVADGLGGTTNPQYKRSELEAAHVPNLDRLVRDSAAGLTIPVAPGITPGSGPGHLSLFGYDPMRYLIGRGVLEAIGVGMEIRKGDIAARGNLATVNKDGLLVDRRAGRIASELAAPIAEELNAISLDPIDVTVTHVKEYRFVLRLRGRGLSDQITETDPQLPMLPPLPVASKTKIGTKTSQLANRFVSKASELLSGRDQANMVLLRGWSTLPDLPQIGEVLRLNPAAIAAYPMYRGLAELVGMKVIPTGYTFESEFETLKSHYAEHDFFYIHFKSTDAAGEDGDFEAKKRALESLDGWIPNLLDLKPDVFIVAGDHSTPSAMAGHSWHPVPFLLHSKHTAGEGVDRFHERALRGGSLGQFPAKDIMSLAMAHAGKLLKFGA